MGGRLLDIRGIGYRYNRSSHTALSDVSLRLEKGEILGLLGNNGAGKTTLVSVISGLLQPHQGTVKLDGKPVSLGGRDVSLVPQEYAFYHNLTMGENLDFFASALKLQGKAKKKAIELTIKRCLLEDVLGKKANACSGGERRRLNLAIGILVEPQILILDEPTANVDPLVRQTIIDLVLELNDAGVGVIYTSHLLSEVETLCGSLVVLDQGRVVASGGMKKLLEDHQPVFTVDFEGGEIKDELFASHRVKERGDSYAKILVDGSDDAMALVAKWHAAGINLSSFDYSGGSLHDFYLSLSKKDDMSE